MKTTIEKKLRNLLKYKKYETIANKATEIAKKFDFDIEYENRKHYTCNDTIIISDSFSGITLDCSEKKIMHTFK